MHKFHLLLFVFSIQFIVAQSSGLSKSIEVKLEKTLIEHYSKNYHSKEKVNLSPALLKRVNCNLETDQLYRIKDKASANIGYAYVGAAKSKVALFDFVVFFDQNLTITTVKVLVYREDHGGEITSKRWLKQFLGFNITQEIVYRKDIAGISGATISATSLTNAVNNVLKCMGNLYELKLL